MFDRAYPRNQAEAASPEEEELTWKQRDPGIPVPPDLKNIVSQRTVRICAHYKHEGVVYSRASTHLGNSLVLFHPAGNFAQSPIPGCIEYIF
jgi:hypothetical protein